MALRTDQQMIHIAAVSKTLREQFNEELPARKIYQDFTFEQADSAIETLTAILTAHQAAAKEPTAVLERAG